MKNRIAVRLSVYFVAALVLFALALSVIFFTLFRANTIELHKNELEQRAKTIAESLSSVASTGNGKGQGQSSGYGAYIKFLNDIAMADVWIVDENLNIITYGRGPRAPSSTSELPTDARQVVNEAFDGKTEFSESFNNLLDILSLTVATPIKSADGEVIGAVLLHSPVDGIDLAVSSGVIIMGVSLGAALIIAIVLSIWLSFGFTRPLKRINNAAIKLAAGDYSAKTDIRQKDEIGTLAGNMDILARRLYEASNESEKLEGLKRDFIANISHELKTPVTVIRGSLEALADGVVTEEGKIKEYYAQMLSESRHLQRLVSDLLDLSRLQNIEFKLEMSDVDLGEVVTDVLRSAKSLAGEKSLEISFDNKAENSIVLGDYGRLRQMLWIVMDNAIKFSPQNGHIYICLKREERLILSVRDEGPGISEKDLPYIFDRFYKTKSAENKTGTGLGLAIAKQIALRHSTEIKAVSVLGEGSEFIFKFGGWNNGKKEER